MGDRYQEKSSSVYVGQLDYGATEDDLTNIFDKYGQVTQVNIITDRETGRSRGFAFVSFDNPDDVHAAIDGANGATINGRAITTELSRPKRNDRGGEGGGYRSRGGGYRGGDGGGGYRGGDSGGYRGGDGGGYRGGDRGGDRYSRDDYRGGRGRGRGRGRGGSRSYGESY